MEEAGIKVLFIMGWGRSGSTLLDNVLGELDGFTSLGELHYLWRRGFIRQHSCGCRKLVAECELWSRVLDTPFGEGKLGDLDPAEVDRWQHDSIRMRHFRRLIRLEPGHPTGWTALDRYSEALGAVYRAVARVDGSHVLVDSSKRPSDGAVVRLLDGIDAYYLQLVRDPRATAYSWRRIKPAEDARVRRMRRYGPVDSAVRWLNRNGAAERLRERVGPGRSMLLRYEDFVEHPREAVASIVRLLGEDPKELPFRDERTVELGINHTVSGNQRRFVTGPVTVRRDDEWLRKQKRADRVITTAITLPKLRSYGYPVRVPASAETAEERAPATTG